MSNRKPSRGKGRSPWTLLAGLGLVILVTLATGQLPQGLVEELTGPAPVTAIAPAPEASAPGPGSSEASPAITARPTSASGLPAIRLDELPPEARETIRRIRQGGPFPFRKDGSVFQNREGLLPSKPRGYYREYTVITPGEDDRGARRIVAGEGGELYYTEDHYNSFWEVVEPAEGTPAEGAREGKP